MKKTFIELSIGDEFYFFNETSVYYSKEKVKGLSANGTDEMIIQFNHGSISVPRLNYDFVDAKTGFHISLLKSAWIRWIEKYVKQDIKRKEDIQDRTENEIQKLKQLLISE